MVIFPAGSRRPVLCRACISSAKAPVVSTPVGPPPTTTTSRAPGSAEPRPAMASRSRCCRCRRSRSASATEYSGNACSAAPGTPKKFGRAPAAMHQVRARQGLPVRQHQAGWGERDCRHLRGHECHRRVVREDHPMRPGDVFGGELRTRHLVEQRLELVVVVAVDQHHVDPLVAQLLRTGDSGQSTAQDEHPIGHRVGPVHPVHSSSRSARMIRPAASMRARWEKACGKLPRWRARSTSNSSA